MNENPRVYLHLGCMRAAPSVEQQPFVELLQWRVFALPDGALLLNGMLAERPTICTTTPIVSVAGCEVVTSSGRRYRLIGAPASDPEVLAIMADKMICSGLPCYTDVSAAFEDLLREGA